MPIRSVKQQSDRGSIKDIQKSVNDFLGEQPQKPPTPYELRLKSLYEQAVISHDQALLDSLPFIAINGSAKNPVSILRHKEYVSSLSVKLAEQIKKTEQELAQCFIGRIDSAPEMLMKEAEYKRDHYREIIVSDGVVKTASAINPLRRVSRSFGRAS